MTEPITGDNIPAAGEGEKLVPLSVVTALQEENKNLKSTSEIQNDQIRLYQANQPAKVTPAQSNVEPSLEGKEDDDIITVGDVKKIMAGQENKIQGLFAGLEVRADNADFITVVNKYVPILAKERPDLAQAISQSGNPALLAYEYCKSLPQYQKDQAEAELKGVKKDKDGNPVVKEEELSEAARKLLENSAKPGSPSGAPGGGGGESTAEHFAKMSEEDLEKHIEEVKAKA